MTGIDDDRGYYFEITTSEDYRKGAAVAFGLMGMAEEIQKKINNDIFLKFHRTYICKI